MSHIDISDRSSLMSQARRVLTEEAAAIEHCGRTLESDRFAGAVDLIARCDGRVVVTGIGKNSHIGRKFSSTLCSTGTPAVYLHPAEALHGDLGVLTPSDVVCAFSYSGESEEVLAILPAIGRLEVPIVSFTGRPESTLARLSRIVLNVAVEREACPMNLAPTTSTTVMLALSDALAITVMEARRFTPADFALRHPGGSLGRRLLMRVGDVMRRGDDVAIVAENATMLDAMLAVQRARAGAAIVVDANGVLAGIMVEGDVRRAITADRNSLDAPMASVMNRNPGTVDAEMLASEALRKLEEFHPVKGELVGEAPVVDSAGRPVGMLMLKDLMKMGIAPSPTVAI
jgi:arabinose-5-phosphate isomerase